MSRPRVYIKSLFAASLKRFVQGKVRQARVDISSEVASLWRSKLMSTHLSSAARRRYGDAITPYSPPRTGAYLSDFVATLLETGWKRFDMKPGLLGDRKHRVIPLLTDGQRRFRSVSVKSLPSSWIHPGFRGAHLAERVRRSIGRLVKEALK